MLALTIPWLLALLTIATIVCMIKKKWKVTLLLFGVMLAFNWWSECIPVRINLFDKPERGRSIKVLSYNIDGSMELIRPKASAIANLIKQNNPDIVFIAEFSELYPDALDTLLRDTYPYTTYRCHIYYSNYFYSRYPIVSHRKLTKDNGQNICCHEGKLDVYGDTITVLGCHLSSNNYTQSRAYITPDSINSGRDMITYIKDIKYAHNMRVQETNTIAKTLTKCNSPIILMGDFNDVGGSVAIRTLEKVGLKNAWWERGVGYGATIHKPLPYRIDHIMYSPELKLQKIEVVSSKGLSDHDALYAEFIY